MVNIGRTTVVQAELVGVLEGLKLARNLGFQKLLIEVDANLVVTLLHSLSDFLDHAYANLIVECKRLMAGFQQVELRHIWREGNKCADRLAAMAQVSSAGVSFLASPPTELAPLLAADSRGIEFLRL
nr:hypothetical protein [Solanum melongena]WMB97159.1 hypothetical protein [Solanum aethiopicum]